MQLNNLNPEEILKIVEVLQLTNEKELASKVFAQFNNNVGSETTFFSDIENWRTMDQS